MENKNFELEINDNIHIRDNFWTGILVVASGTIGVALSNVVFVAKSILIPLGIMTFLLFLRGYFARIGIIDKLRTKNSQGGN